MLFGGIILPLSATSFNASIEIGFNINATTNSPLSTRFLILCIGILPGIKEMFFSISSSLISKIGDRIFLN